MCHIELTHGLLTISSSDLKVTLQLYLPGLFTQILDYPITDFSCT